MVDQGMLNHRKGGPKLINITMDSNEHVFEVKSKVKQMLLNNFKS